MRISSTDLVARAPAPSASATPTVAASRGETPPSFARVLSDLGDAVGRDDAGARAALEALRGGSDPGPERLLSLQLGVYRYGEAIDLASRLVDRATGAVKTVVQGSGQ